MTQIPNYLNSQQQPREVRGSGGAWSLRLTGPLVWGWAALLFCLVTGFLGTFVLGPLGSLLALIGAVFLVSSISYAARSQRRGRRLAILSYLENAVRLNLPLSPFIRAAAQGERGRMRRRLQDLAQGLDSGAPAGDVLQRCVPEVPADLAAAITSAERVGQLGPTLSRVLDEQINDPGTGTTFRAAVAIYPLVMSFAVLTVVTGLAIFIFPKFDEIFVDFKGTPPEITQRVIGFCRFLVDSYLFIPLWILLFLAILFVLGRGLRFIFTPWWPSLVVGPVSKRLGWYVPLWGTLQGYRALGRVCHFLADATRAGVAFPDALLQAEKLEMSRSMRDRLVAWRTAASQGTSIPDAAAAARLPAVLVGFLSTTQAPGKIGDPEAFAGALEFLGRYYQARFSRLAMALSAAIKPLVTLAVAAMVATVVLAVFLPLVSLIKLSMTSFAKDLL